MRQQGYDIIAQPCLPEEENDTLKTNPFSIWNFNAFDKDHTKRVQVDREGNGKDKIIEFLKKCGNGARVEIVVEWVEGVGGAHAFAAKIVDGEVLFIDPQSGKVGEAVERYFGHVKNGETRWLRIDGLTINESHRKGVVKNPHGNTD